MQADIRFFNNSYTKCSPDLILAVVLCLTGSMLVKSDINEACKHIKPTDFHSQEQNVHTSSPPFFTLPRGLSSSVKQPPSSAIHTRIVFSSFIVYVTPFFAHKPL